MSTPRVNRDWPLDARTIIECARREFTRLGPLSTAISIFQALQRFGKSNYLLDQARAELGTSVPFFDRICGFHEISTAPIENHLINLQEAIRVKVPIAKTMVICGYESLVWDPIFRCMPEVDFFFVHTTAEPSPRLLTLQDQVQPIDLFDVELCPSPGAVSIFPVYGHVPGDPSKVYTTAEASIVHDLKLAVGLKRYYLSLMEGEQQQENINLVTHEVDPAVEFISLSRMGLPTL